MSIKEIKDQLLKYKSEGKKIFTSSSFQTHSIPLLHIVSSINVEVDVLFINTGFHFPETISFRDKIVKQLHLNLIDVRSAVSKIQQKDEEGQFYFISDPDYCCYLNKTQPIEPYLQIYDVWISGIRADQNTTRKNLKNVEHAPYNTLRFHPIIDWNFEQIEEYRKLHNLPEHPLVQNGYKSIGCAPCTRKFEFDNERASRWYGMNKNECGLHTDLIIK
ncbi:MAG: phosphoadenosine phosphosulfate reductase [Bacteroidetes bacterium RIFCSPLOWO2_02_FULL_36_8]|nr:MAG: phosphoadenosine phosphosulfate reductase [Bacteroidetes bacterium RIFCSPLOWO2_02_FULL_36_8]OFY71325.1 MAG: phosphoadenosine phosphosulfate reductase [Bacteroidetes bacterium RIFCSPLOWO2_12_FULL_37_12]